MAKTVVTASPAPGRQARPFVGDENGPGFKEFRDEDLPGEVVR